VRVLTYHRVLPAHAIGNEFVQPGMYVTDVTFERHVAYLRREFRILSVGEMLDLWDTGRWDARERYCVITFDDGWADTFRHAFPILRSHEVPATVFLPTERIGTTRWFWPDRLGYLLMRLGTASRDVQLAVWALLAQGVDSPEMPRGTRWAERSDAIIERCKGLPSEAVEEMIEAAARRAGLAFPSERCLLSWGEVDDMGKQGISFGSHSATHRILTGLTQEEVRFELESSLATLRTRHVNAVAAIAYPNGDTNAVVAESTRLAGYRAAFTTKAGAEGPLPGDRFALRRIGVHEDISATTSLFAFHVSRPRGARR